MRGSPSVLKIAIPHYADFDFLMRSIESVLAQKDSAWELCIFDDSPKKDSRIALFDRYRSHPRIRFQENDGTPGMARNWNRALEWANDGWLTILHSDDELAPNYVSAMRNWIADETDATLLFCGAHIIGSNSQPAFSFVDFAKLFFRPNGKRIDLVGNEGAFRLLKGNFIPCPAVCYNVSRIAGIHFDEELKFVTDLDFYLQTLEKGFRIIGFPNERAYRYRRHPHNTTAIMNRSFERFFEERRFRRAKAEQYEKSGWKLAAAAARSSWVINTHFVLEWCKTFLFHPSAWNRAASVLRHWIRGSRSVSRIE